jgi:hypothetical protein
MKKLVRGLTEKRTPDGICVLNCHYTADPDRAKPEWKEQERRKYTSKSKWQAEQEMIFGAGGGERLFADILNTYGHKIIIDPETSGFRPSPHWNYIGGFDYGQANPTAALVACVDYDGTIYVLREYYQPGFTPKEHRTWLLQLQGFKGTPMFADPSIFYKTHAQNDGTFKAIASLFADEGIDNLGPAPENNELLGMQRILSHWMNLDQREPTLKIVCPKAMQDIAKPDYGIVNGGCPNLLWELRRARRAERTPTQLATQNPTEKIVDKDNHLRDCLKYLVLASPALPEKSWQQLATEAVAPLAAQGDVTSAYIRFLQAKAEAEANDRPIITIGRYRPRRRY